MGQAGLAKMHLRIDYARQDVQPLAVDHLGRRTRFKRTDCGDTAVGDRNIAHARAVVIDHGAGLQNHVVGSGHDSWVFTFQHAGRPTGPRAGLVVYVLAAYVPQQHVARDFCMKTTFLPDRGVVKVSGESARDFLNGLVTTDLTLLRPGLGRFGALLTPQGKIVADFLITEAPAGHGGGFLIDCPRALAQTLADKLGFYKLRAKVGIENLSDSLGVLAAWMAISR